MYKKRYFPSGLIILLFTMAACNATVPESPIEQVEEFVQAEPTEQDTQNEQILDPQSIILANDFTNEERNRYLSEDVEYFGRHIAENHRNPFDNITRQEFEERIAELSSRVSELDNLQVIVELNKIWASIGDARTTMGYSDGYSYPFNFEIFDGELYIMNTVMS